MRVLLLSLLSACSAPVEGPNTAEDPDDPTPDTSSDDTVATGLDATGDTTDTSGAPDTAPPTVSLYGSTVTFSLHCCTQPPDQDNRIDPSMVSEVGDGVEFEQITDPWATLNADVDIEERALTIRYLESESALARPFNGYVFRFADGPFGRITGVRHDAARSTVGARQIRLNHTDHAVWVDVSGLAVTPTSVIALEIDAR